MEREIVCDLGNGMAQKQIIPDRMPKEPEFALEREMELADIVCIFTSPEQPGIMFYDRTPEPSPEARFAVNLEEGKYITDRASISRTEWNEKIHIANGDRSVRFREGTAKVTTIIVTEEKMKDILDGISKSEDPSRIVIDTGRVMNHLYAEQMMNSNNIDTSKVNYDNFKQARDEVMKSMEQYNRLDNSDIPTFNNTDTSGKGLK